MTIFRKYYLSRKSNSSPQGKLSVEYNKDFWSFLLLLAALTCALPAATQSSDSLATGVDSPYRQGRWLVGLNGFLNASNSDQGAAQPDTASFSNGHNIDLRAGYFLRDRMAAGLLLGTTRRNTREQFTREQETVFAGPWIRYYLQPGSASLYPELSFVFTHFYESNELSVNGRPVFNRVLEGNGIGAGLGLGFAYAVADLLVFDVRLNYSYFFLNGRFEDRLEGISSERDFTRWQINFAFGFNVLIRK